MKDHLEENCRTAFQIADHFKTHKTVRVEDYKWVSLDWLRKNCTVALKDGERQ